MARSEPPEPLTTTKSAQEDASRRRLSGVAGRRFTAANAWLDLRIEWVIWLVALAGFIIRFQRARNTYLNGDETQIINPPLQHRLADVFKASAYLPYGPLMNVVLHYMALFGHCELYLRMPSVVAGALLVVVAYKWVEETFNKGAAFVVAWILAFAPPLITLSAQIRFYMMQAFFMTCSLYCLERALRTKSPRWMNYFGITLLLALLTMYMSAWYVAGLGAYVVVCILWEGLPKPLTARWVVTQVAGAAILAVAYVTQLRMLRGDPAEMFARTMYLRGSYFHPENETLAHYLLHATRRLFGYIFAHAALGRRMIIVFAIGLGLIIWGGRLWRSGEAPAKRRISVLSLVLPLAVTAAAGTMSIYPYGGSRHDAFLAVFIAAGVSVAISALAGGNAAVLLLAGACVVPVWLRHAQHHFLDDFPQVTRIDQMRRALDYLSSRDPAPRVLMVDQIGDSTVRYYICHGQSVDWQRLGSDSSTYRCGDYQILTVNAWAAPPSAFPATLARARHLMPGLFPGPVWLFYESPLRRTGQTVYGDHCAVFGKLEVYLVSP